MEDKVQADGTYASCATVMIDWTYDYQRNYHLVL